MLIKKSVSKIILLYTYIHICFQEIPHRKNAGKPLPLPTNYSPKSQLSPSGSSAKFVRPWVFVGIPGSNGTPGGGGTAEGFEMASHVRNCLEPKWGLLFWYKFEPSFLEAWSTLSTQILYPKHGHCKKTAILLKAPQKMGKSFGTTSFLTCFFSYEMACIYKFVSLGLVIYI